MTAKEMIDFFENKIVMYEDLKRGGTPARTVEKFALTNANKYLIDETIVITKKTIDFIKTTKM
jgi:hypothetical protein